MNEPTIILNEVKLTRPGGFSLQHLSLELPAGAHLVVTGPSGSGKTSLGMALAGKLFVTGLLEIRPLNENASGKKNQMVDQRYEIKNRSNTVDGYYQQRYNSLDNEDAYTVMEELLLIQDDPELIKEHLNDFNIGYLADKTMLTLSSGEHKRFQLVKMLLSPAPIVILDEPFVGLDVQARGALNKMLEKLALKGIQIITLTGAREHFPEIATHILELQKGNVVYFGEITGYEPGFQPEVANYDLAPLTLQRADRKAEAPQAIVKMVDLHISYSDKIIFEKLNWTVKPAERWLLKGPNGAGKSTLLSLVYGDNPKAYANQIYLFDKRRGTGESIWDIKKRMGYVSPELHAFFDKNISCFSAVASGYCDTMGLYRKLNEQETNQVDAWLKTLDLTAIRDKKLSQISTGQQRLIMLLRAFIKSPPLLILDEPCQGLDQWQTEAFVRLVEDYCLRTGATLIYISHYASEIPSVVSQVMELQGDGKGGYRIYEANRTTQALKEQQMLAAT
ncbi:ATP-binding cassette domain-containing protein [Arachidicoccus terrestris]|uniref:ATP-binding cassette domain-containing protein n=1 Tax=Arachidicoccus terrestris TaxID=2875539 RepID=UPI001CC40C2C|nr:ATP-binding cassette domain-containing protein [Arachidicoccus terrestris]UAY54982.1 ATP-binding cassette domain-containing protein [Arachidicoccus terrestris]